MASIEPEASVVQVGLGIRYIGQHAYANSGDVSTTTAVVNLLEFTTGAGYLVGTFTPFHGAATTVNMQFIIYFNNLLIAQVSTREAYDFARANPMNIIIPPLTLVKVTAEGLEAGTNDTQAIIVGRVYGAV